MNLLSDLLEVDDVLFGEESPFKQQFTDKTTGLFPEEIRANAMNKWLFNKDTVNKVLDALMQNGLKIEGGDKLGRTIIFAVNQDHAKFIVDCFTERYPHLPSGFRGVQTGIGSWFQTNSPVDSTNGTSYFGKPYNDS